MELALISFDGIDPRVIYNNRDELDAFDSLIDESMHGEWSTPGHTIPSFTATLTGRQYNEVNFHWDDDGGNYQRHRQTGYDYLWDVCDSSMTLLNIPVIYPPEDIDDAMVCGFLTPDEVADSNLARPQEVQDMINDLDYIHDVHADKTYESLGGDGMVDHLQDMMHTRVDAAEHLIDEYDSDLFYGVWTATDRWFHQCHLHGEDFMPLYRAADEVLSRILNIIPSDVPLICFSDHGFAHFPGDEGVHKGHAYKGWYSIRTDEVPSYRDDSLSIFDLFPTVVNYLEGDVPDGYTGRIMFHTKEQGEQVKDRLDGLGYLE